MVIAFTIPSFAQFETNRGRSRYNRDDTERYYGLRLGMNVASTSSESNAFDTNPRTGLVIGFAYGMQLSSTIPFGWRQACCILRREARPIKMVTR